MRDYNTKNTTNNLTYKVEWGITKRITLPSAYATAVLLLGPHKVTFMTEHRLCGYLYMYI